MESSSSNPYVTVEVGEEDHSYPYPSNLSASSFVSVKLSGRGKYLLGQQEELSELHQTLYIATLHGDWTRVYTLRHDVSIIDKITNNGNTALHIAVGTTNKPRIIFTLLGIIPEDTKLVDVKNSDGSTVLHVAATVGHTTTAHILLDRDPDLLLATDNEGRTPLLIALSNMHNEMANYLLERINSDKGNDIIFSGTNGNELLVTVISSKNFGLANKMLEHYTTFQGDAVLMAIAQNFPCQLNVLEAFYVERDTYIPVEAVRKKITYKRPVQYTIDKCIPSCSSWVKTIKTRFFKGIFTIFFLFQQIPKMLVWPFIKQRVRIYKDAWLLIWGLLHKIELKYGSRYLHEYHTNPIFEATRQNAYEVVEAIVHHFPNAIWSVNKDGHNIIQYAVISRSEKVYNLLYQMSQHKNVYRTIKDPSGNNLLHLAARLAPSNKLSLLSGAALQIQRELQWFQEVNRFVCPLNITQKNSIGETPQMVFTREHKDLVLEGEKWMKTTAESYTITAALIATIMFAAAITVPGGNNQDTGIPIFTTNSSFKIFAISDAISLFTSVTSLLMFLSILTARFAEQDFLYKLPTKLIIGLATLCISTTTMIIAFGATLYLVFGHSNSRILIPIAVLTCLPITSFATLQLPLVIELMSATYGRSIFRKIRDRPFY